MVKEKSRSKVHEKNEAKPGKIKFLKQKPKNLRQVVDVEAGQ